MDFAKRDHDLKALQQRYRALGLAFFGVLAALLACLVLTLNLLGMQRTIVVPPTIDKTFWVTRDQASSAYLEQMGSFIAWLILDVSPATIDWKKSVLLDYVAPADHGTLQTRQDLEAARLQRMNATTSFLPQQLVANEAEQTVVIRGRLRTHVNGTETTTATKAYLAAFAYTGGRLHLTTFRELPP